MYFNRNLPQKCFILHNHSLSTSKTRYCFWMFCTVLTERFLRDLQHSLTDASGDQQEAPSPPLLASSNWSVRKSLYSESWRAERPRMVNTAVAQENVAAHICQQCVSNPAVVRCRDCRPRPFFCAECDSRTHTTHVLHNRDAMTAGFFQPLPPTTSVVDKAFSHCGKFRFVSVQHVSHSLIV